MSRQPAPEAVRPEKASSRPSSPARPVPGSRHEPSLTIRRVSPLRPRASFAARRPRHAAQALRSTKPTARNPPLHVKGLATFEVRPTGMLTHMMSAR